MVEKAQPLLVDVPVVEQDLMAENVDLAVEIKETHTQALVEVFHLETQKKPSNLTYSL